MGRRLGVRGRSGLDTAEYRKSLVLAGNQTPDIQPVAHRLTDRAISAPIYTK
jgi:hypothetical protein